MAPVEFFLFTVQKCRISSNTVPLRRFYKAKSRNEGLLYSLKIFCLHLAILELKTKKKDKSFSTIVKCRKLFVLFLFENTFYDIKFIVQGCWKEFGKKYLSGISPSRTPKWRKKLTAWPGQANTMHRNVQCRLQMDFTLLEYCQQMEESADTVKNF